jgi:SHS2 domain-containing protein
MEAFYEAANATFEVILDKTTVASLEFVELSVRGIDLEELLVEWIGSLIALIDTNNQFYSKFNVDEISRESEGYILRGRAFGESIDFSRHITRTEVKAMTYADMKIIEDVDKTTLWFTLDL